jgi:hypothetical protein
VDFWCYKNDANRQTIGTVQGSTVAAMKEALKPGLKMTRQVTVDGTRVIAFLNAGDGGETRRRTLPQAVAHHRRFV